MIRRALFAFVALSMVAAPSAAQQRRPPPPPKLTGIDALRAEFFALAGTDTVFFGGASSSLSAPAKTVLQRQAAWLRRHPELIVSVEGHADAGDTRDRALAIAARRAAEVRDYLILFGVLPSQVTATSWGKERAPAPGLSEPALAANRRVQIVLVR